MSLLPLVPSSLDLEDDLPLPTVAETQEEVPSHLGGLSRTSTQSAHESDVENRPHGSSLNLPSGHSQARIPGTDPKYVAQCNARKIHAQNSSAVGSDSAFASATAPGPVRTLPSSSPLPPPLAAAAFARRASQLQRALDASRAEKSVLRAHAAAALAARAPAPARSLWLSESEISNLLRAAASAASAAAAPAGSAGSSATAADGFLTRRTRATSEAASVETIFGPRPSDAAYLSYWRALSAPRGIPSPPLGTNHQRADSPPGSPSVDGNGYYGREAEGGLTFRLDTDATGNATSTATAAAAAATAAAAAAAATAVPLDALPARCALACAYLETLVRTLTSALARVDAAATLVGASTAPVPAVEPQEQAEKASNMEPQAHALPASVAAVVTAAVAHACAAAGAGVALPLQPPPPPPLSAAPAAAAAGVRRAVAQARVPLPIASGRAGSGVVGASSGPGAGGADDSSTHAIAGLGGGEWVAALAPRPAQQQDAPWRLDFETLPRQQQSHTHAHPAGAGAGDKAASVQVRALAAFARARRAVTAGTGAPSAACLPAAAGAAALGAYAAGKAVGADIGRLFSAWLVPTPETLLSLHPSANATTTAAAAMAAPNTGAGASAGAVKSWSLLTLRARARAHGSRALASVAAAVRALVSACSAPAPAPASAVSIAASAGVGAGTGAAGAGLLLLRLARARALLLRAGHALLRGVAEGHTLLAAAALTAAVDAAGRLLTHAVSAEADGGDTTAAVQATAAAAPVEAAAGQDWVGGVLECLSAVWLLLPSAADMALTSYSRAGGSGGSAGSLPQSVAPFAPPLPAEAAADARWQRPLRALLVLTAARARTVTLQQHQSAGHDFEDGGSSCSSSDGDVSDAGIVISSSRRGTDAECTRRLSGGGARRKRAHLSRSRSGSGSGSSNSSSSSSSDSNDSASDSDSATVDPGRLSVRSLGRLVFSSPDETLSQAVWRAAARLQGLLPVEVCGGAGSSVLERELEGSITVTAVLDAHSHSAHGNGAHSKTGIGVVDGSSTDNAGAGSSSSSNGQHRSLAQLLGAETGMGATLRRRLRLAELVCLTPTNVGMRADAGVNAATDGGAGVESGSADSSSAGAGTRRQPRRQQRRQRLAPAAADWVSAPAVTPLCSVCAQIEVLGPRARPPLPPLSSIRLAAAAAGSGDGGGGGSGGSGGGNGVQVSRSRWARAQTHFGGDSLACGGGSVSEERSGNDNESDDSCDDDDDDDDDDEDDDCPWPAGATAALVAADALERLKAERAAFRRRARARAGGSGAGPGPGQISETGSGNESDLFANDVATSDDEALCDGFDGYRGPAHPQRKPVLEPVPVLVPVRVVPGLLPLPPQWER